MNVRGRADRIIGIGPSSFIQKKALRLRDGAKKKNRSERGERRKKRGRGEKKRVKDLPIPAPLRGPRRERRRPMTARKQRAGNQNPDLGNQFAPGKQFYDVGGERGEDTV